MALRASKPSFNVREKLTELGRRFGLKGSELVAAETVQEAREVVSAGRKNLIINGSFLVSQRATSATRSSASTAMSTVDRFSAKFYGGGWGSNHSTESQSTDAPPGHSYSYKVLADVAQNYSSSMGSWIQYNFEGNQLLSLKTKDLGYKTFTISFWVKSNKTGYVTFSSETSGQGHSFSTAVQINTAGVWEYKTVTVPASPSSQLSETEFKSTDSEFNIKWGLGSNGAWLVGTDDSWQPVASNRGVVSSLQTNFQAAQNDYLAIGGIQLEVGKNATDFEYRSYGEELALCQRYFFKSLATRQSILYKGPLWESAWYSFPVEMRANPTLAGGSWFLRNPGSNSNISYSGFVTTMFRTGFYITSTTTNTNTFQCWFNDAPLTATAEL
jgi:hypothetical protein